MMKNRIIRDANELAAAINRLNRIGGADVGTPQFREAESIRAGIDAYHERERIRAERD